MFDIRGSSAGPRRGFYCATTPSGAVSSLKAAANNAQNAANELNAAADNTVNPREADEQNVSGM